MYYVCIIQNIICNICSIKFYYFSSYTCSFLYLSIFYLETKLIILLILLLARIKKARKLAYGVNAIKKKKVMNI